MRLECLNERYGHNQALGLQQLMERLGTKMQIATQRYDKRPYGVGMLVAGWYLLTAISRIVAKWVHSFLS